jgi:hypothetical protein
VPADDLAGGDSDTVGESVSEEIRIMTIKGWLKTDVQIKAVLGTDQWIYLAVGPNVWGKGFTPEQALQAGGITARDGYLLYACADPWACIDGMGSITYTPRVLAVPGTTEYVKVAEHLPKKRS